jgi:chromosome segregation ATPase
MENPKITDIQATPSSSSMSQEESSTAKKAWPILLAGALAVSLGANFYQSQKTSNLTSEVQTLRNDVVAMKTSVKESEESVKRSITGVQESLTAARQEMDKKASQQARVVVQRQTTQLDTKWQKEQAAQLDRLNGELAALRESTQTAATKLTDINTEVGNVKTDVGNVKTEVASTRSELERTIGDLKRVRGDMGEMSGLIATNSKEVTALRALGERNYYEFNLAKKAGQQRVGDVQLAIKKVDSKKNKYSIDLVVDDKKIEKRDKTVNEPVQFYVSSKSRSAYELVVYEVQKDRIVGYLSTPKMQVARNDR